MNVQVNQPILRENDKIAAELRQEFQRAGTLCLNLISSPGAGKTTLLERTLAALNPDIRTAVVTGDIQTDNDARRLARYGFPVRQITTGGICHLDAAMVRRSLSGWNLDELDLFLIENVGNLVCPTSYDLGEHAKVVLLSVTEGEDKPQKYPGIFRKAELVLLTKTDLLPHVQFDLRNAIAHTQALRREIDYICLSAVTGRGLNDWMRWLTNRIRAVRAQKEGALPCELSLNK